MARSSSQHFVFNLLLAAVWCHVVIGGANTTARYTRCEEETHNLEACLKLAKPMLDQASEMGIPSSPDEVNISCTAFKGTMHCFDVFSKSCLNATDKRIMDDQTTGARNMFKFLCDDPAFQIKYLKHIPCYKKNKKGWDSCANRFTELVKEEMTRSNGTDHSRQVEICCSQYGFVRCVYSMAFRNCRREDADFLEQIAETLSSNRAHAPTCRHFDTRVCSSSVGVRHHAALVFLAAILLLLGTW